MNKIETVVNSVEQKIINLVKAYDVLKQNNENLKLQLQHAEATHQEQQLILMSWKEKYEALKFANSILGSNENKKEAKLKINTLIRDIDHCIAQLSD